MNVYFLFHQYNFCLCRLWSSLNCNNFDLFNVRNNINIKFNPRTHAPVSKKPGFGKFVR